MSTLFILLLKCTSIICDCFPIYYWRLTVIDINVFSAVIKTYDVAFHVGLHVVTNLIVMLVALVILVLAILLDVVVGDPSPNSPYAAYYKIHPTVLMGNFIKSLKAHLKNPNPKREKINGIFLGLATVLAFILQCLCDYIGLSLPSLAGSIFGWVSQFIRSWRLFL